MKSAIKRPHRLRLRKQKFPVQNAASPCKIGIYGIRMLSDPGAPCGKSQRLSENESFIIKFSVYYQRILIFCSQNSHIYLIY